MATHNGEARLYGLLDAVRADGDYEWNPGELNWQHTGDVRQIQLLQALNQVLSAGGGIASETDVALGGTIIITSNEQVSETDTALGGTAVMSSTGGLATETETALAGITVFVGGIAQETDTAIEGVGDDQDRITYVGGTAVETQSALAGVSVLIVQGGQAAEVDSALAGTGGLVYVPPTGTVETDLELPGGTVGSGDPDPVIDFNPYSETGYRYFTFDIMTDQLLAEIPLSDVSFSLKLCGVGELTATLPIGQLDYDLDAYGATMPMRTALYVLRDKEAVWGGIIWARDYDANSQTLQLSCATWESYLFRRHIWHTYTTRDDVDQFEVVRQMLYKMRHDFEFDYTAYDFVIPAPQSSTVDIFVNEGEGAGRTQDQLTFDRNEMKSFGEALTEYANNLNGFEWFIRIDFNERALRFRRRLELLRTPPALLRKGSDDPPYDEEHRPGIDTYLFEYPGNIASISLTEDGDNSCTRQFVVGGNPGGGSSKSIGSWNNTEYLAAGYPLIENVEASNHSTTTRMPRLLNLATVYGRDAAPPLRSWNIVVNGSADPVIGSYRVGHWCRLIVHDPFLVRSLASSTDFDPLGGVVKRIVGYSVAVPNGPQTAELVTLELEDDPTVSFDLDEGQDDGSLLDDRGPFYYGTYMPDASTTGVPARAPGDEMDDYNSPSEDSVTLTPGTVIKDKIIYGDIFVTSGNGGPVVLRRCKLVGGNNVPGQVRGVVNVDSAPAKVALVMYDCEIKPRKKSKRRDAVRGRGFEAYRLYAEDVVQGIVLDPGSRTNTNMAVKVMGCFIRALVRVDSRSSRVLVHNGGVNVLVKGNRFVGSAFDSSEDPDDYTGPDDYLVVNNFGDEVIYLDDVSGVAGFDDTVEYVQNFITSGTAHTRIRASVDQLTYQENKHDRNVADNEAEGYPGNWIWIASHDTTVTDLDTNTWRDGPYVGSALSEPRELGIYYGEAAP